MLHGRSACGRASRLLTIATVVTLLSCPLARGQGTPQESSISPEAGDTYPWEAGLQVSTYTRVNLFNGNALTTIPIVSWPAFGPDMDFRLYHNSSAVGSGERAPAPGYGDPPGAPPQASTRYGFAGAWGYQHDALTSGTSAPADLLHVGYRWYSPSIGRFIQRDPIGLLGGLNAYPYAFNSPTGRVDPDGRLSLGRMLIAAGTGAVIVAAALTAWEYFSALGNDALDNFNVYNDLIDRDLRINSGDPAFGNRVPIGDIKEAVGGIARTCPGLTTTGRPTPADTPEEGALEVLPHLIPGTRDD